MTTVLTPHDLLLVRQMQREGAGLPEIAAVMDREPKYIDVMLWRWFGASAGLPTPKLKEAVA